MKVHRLNEIEAATFRREGYLVKRELASGNDCDELFNIAKEHLAEQMAPIEYEVDVQYPGSPANSHADGADTSRRLLQAYSRHAIFRRWANSDKIASTLRGLFGSETVELSQCHHNCIMTKRPSFSSATLWHQDNRYWSFDEENLISVWLALGNESRENGCLRVIPGSHLLDIESGKFDSALFLRPDLPDNKELIQRSEIVDLNRGDVLFFHSRLFHAAGRNLTDETKFSLVFTYHESGNRPISDTRSAKFPSVRLRSS
jgi:phytanoyl-CoA hydroxylase